jgi:hypothetical protein
MRVLKWKNEIHYLTEAEVKALKKRLTSSEKSRGGECPLFDCFDFRDCPYCWFTFGGSLKCHAITAIGDSIGWRTFWRKSQARQAAAARRKLIAALEGLPKTRRR